MAASYGTITLNISMNIEGLGPVPFAPQILVQNGQYGVTPVILQTGFNAISVPSWAQVCIFEFPSTSVSTKTQKGVTGDTGTPLFPTGLNMLNVLGSATLGITASASDTLPTTFMFF